MNAKIVSLTRDTVTAEVFDWSGKSLGTVTVPWDGEGWVSLDQRGWGNEAVLDALHEIGEEGRQLAIDEASAEIEQAILDDYRSRTEVRSDG